MKNKQSVHEAVFQLSYDLGLQIAPKLENLNVKLAPQQLRAMRQIWVDGESTLIDIAKTLKRDKAQIKRLLDELCSLKMIERIPNPNDGRSKLLILTNNGREFFEKVEKVEAEFSKQLTKGIEKEQLDTFFLVSSCLIENLRNID
ncbi:MarR family winged helix-turn-helix transcriptional regulator [Aliikangiella coralliicola]|uniref:MarR family transcriptional regulator n=1 Tax=Aliikangiella coralliicola TaxID=2592383 RepID=A0A545UDN8_9GAMM|nr:MarR family transcriptional regulator [Aliikangiella coralliicola]TQV87587.1 MarR family transcriptional regulator [Aliikangiella coralliicola]